MGVSSVAAVCFILFSFLGYTRASVISKQEIAENRNLEQHYLRITESGTTFAEKIEIDEENDLEYFHVPAHNNVTETADYLYDFKNDMSVRRVKSKAICYLGPLPDDLPKPAHLKAELQRLSQVPPFENQVVVHKYWVISEQVDKTFLRQEVQDFCGQFPIYQLQEVDFNSTGKEDIDGGHTRLARAITLANLTGLGFCDRGLPSKLDCNPDDYIFRIKIGNISCTYWLVCIFDKGARVERCEDWLHERSSMLCYSISCPPKPEGGA